LSGRIREHVRSNVVGYIALFCFAMSGTAVALDGSNTVFSDDIVDNGVRSEDVRNDDLSNGGLQAADLGPSSVGTSEVAPDSLTSADLGNNAVTSRELAPGSIVLGDLTNDSVGHPNLTTGSVASDEVFNNSLLADDLGTDSVGSSEVATDSLSASDLAPNSVGSSEIASLTGSDVIANSLTSREVNEGSLDSPDGQDVHPADCDPGTNYVNCGQLTFSLGRPMAVLLMWNWAFGSPSGDAEVSISCRTLVDGTVTEVHVNNDEDVYALGEAGTPFVDVRSLGAGNHVAQFQCAQITGDANVQDPSIAAIELAVD
jgi:hypothetical protein